MGAIQGFDIGFSYHFDAVTHDRHVTTFGRLFALVVHGQVLERAAARVAELHIRTLQTARILALTKCFHFRQRVDGVTILVFRFFIRGWTDFFAVLSTIRRVKHVDDGTLLTFELHDIAFTNTLHLPWTWWIKARLRVYALIWLVIRFIGVFCA